MYQLRPRESNRELEWKMSKGELWWLQLSEQERKHMQNTAISPLAPLSSVGTVALSQVSIYPGHGWL